MNDSEPSTIISSRQQRPPQHRFPIFLALENQPVVVIGGGATAARKLPRLLAAGANVTLVAPTLCESLAALVAAYANNATASDKGCCHHVVRTWQADDLAHCLLAIAATDDDKENTLIAESAEQQNVWVNAVDNARVSRFMLPSIIDRSPLYIAVSSGGTTPILNRLISARISAFLPAAYRDLAAFAARHAQRLRDRVENVTVRRRFWERQLTGPVAELILQGRTDDAEAALVAAMDKATDAAPQGEVFLVGAGPGDPDLLTFRALRLMQQADVVLFDRLVSESIMAMVPEHVERIYVGKRKNHHTLPQGSINATLVALANEGKRVLRLKGGDPFMFGRGGEEIDTLAENGVPFQVVPGITAAAGCASYAGIPLTHREHAQACVFVTGHLKDGSLNLPWQTLIQPQQTVVIYMGLTALAQITREMVAHGKPADTPAALIARGTTANQQVVEGTLKNLTDRVAQADVHAPTLIIIGEVVTLRERLAWWR